MVSVAKPSGLKNQIENTQDDNIISQYYCFMVFIFAAFVKISCKNI